MQLSSALSHVVHINDKYMLNVICLHDLYIDMHTVYRAVLTLNKI